MPTRTLQARTRAALEGHMTVGVQTLNGLPALVFSVRGGRARVAPFFVLRIDVDADGRIATVYSVLASRKLTAVARPS